MKIGILGGTFDPLHNGHIKMAEAVQAQCDLDRVIYVPCLCSPHKQNSVVTDGALRLKMLEQMCHTYSSRGWMSSNIELLRESPSYMIDTLKAFNAEYANDGLILIIGEDQWMHFETWKDCQKIKSLVKIAVCHRPGVDVMRADDRDANMIWVPTVNEDVSSTQIRQKVSAGQDISDDVPAIVAEMIATFGLYKRSE